MKFSLALRPLVGAFLLWPIAVGAADAQYPTPYSFSTLAGTSSFGSTDGPGSTARFAWPQGVAVDRNGNIYVADADNSTIRKVTPAGLVSTLAGKAGYYESVDGTGSAARFYFPFGVATDPSGNIYATENNTIRKITPAGEVTTFAGEAGVAGSTDGLGRTARFGWVVGLAFDLAGNLYVADNGNHTIRKITPAGVVSTLAGLAGNPGQADGSGSVARFSYPSGVAVDQAGTIYVNDTWNQTIRKISPAGIVTTLAGTPGVSGAADGTGPAASFFQPRGIGVDAAGNVYVNDAGNHTIRKITPAGVVSTLAGSAGFFGSADGTGSQARFVDPTGLAIDAAGNLYAVDSVDCTLRKISPNAEVTTLAGLGRDNALASIDGTGSAARFNILASIAVGPDGQVYAADYWHSTIRKVTAGGVVTTLAGTADVRGSADGTGAAARFNAPFGVAVDPTSTVYATDSGNNTIRKITPAGVVTTLAGIAGTTGSSDGTGSDAAFHFPYGIATDRAGNLYVTELGNYTVRKVTPAGVVTTLAGKAGHFGNADGPGDVARFNRPLSIAVDLAGNAYVLDAGTSSSVIRKITPTGVVTTLAATEGPAGTITVDVEGNIFVAGLTIRKITPAGVVTVLAGLAESPGTADGMGDEARFSNPQGIAIDQAGNLYISNASTIRKGRLAGPPTISAQPQSMTVAAGESVQFSVNASGVPDPTYQWFFNGSPFNGATNSALSFNNARSTDAGEYSVSISNEMGTVTSAKAILTIATAPITPSTPTTAPASSSGGGGGGAPSAWFYAALLILAATRGLSMRAAAHGAQLLPLQ